MISIRQFDVPEDHPQAYDEVHCDYAPRIAAALPAGDDAVDAEYVEVDGAVQ